LYVYYLFFPGWNYLFVGEASHVVDNGFSRSLKSDIGYVRDLWSMGYFFSVFYYLPFILMIVTAINGHLKLLLIVVIFTSIIFHCKENFYYVRMLFPLTILMWINLTKKSSKECVEF